MKKHCNTRDNNENSNKNDSENAREKDKLTTVRGQSENIATQKCKLEEKVILPFPISPISCFLKNN